MQNPLSPSDSALALLAITALLVSACGSEPASPAESAAALEPAAQPAPETAAPSEPVSLQALADGAHRSAEHRARNDHRRPVETLEFFGIKPDMTVVEVSPGGSGWYTEILAPYLRDGGLLYLGSYAPDAEEEYYRRNAKRFADKLAENPALYGSAKVTVFDPPNQLDAAPAGSADMVLTFRNIHNWIGDGDAEVAMRAMYSYLKPGGVLGLVQHRGNSDMTDDPSAEMGYVRESDVIAMAEAVGFELAARSEINANPKDTKDHPEGVWTLPPGYQLGDVDREKYAAIGESDRMTLKFVKPSDG
ncbi:MAG: methyltransferase [Pseudomonadota bacterium]